MYDNPHEQKIAESMGYADKNQPHVSFFDHATQDAEKTQASGRPRFKERVYIQKIPSAPDLVVRDIFTRAATEEDKREYPEAWARYQARKESVSNLRPPIIAIPGMSISAKFELEALGIRDCEAFANYEKDLDELEPLRQTAKKIMEVSNGIGTVRQEREVVRVEANRQQDNSPGMYRGCPKNLEEKESKPEETVSYNWSVSF